MMFRFGGRLVLQGLQQKSAGNRLCGNATAVKMAGRNVQEVLIPVPWGHVAGRIAQKYNWNSQDRRRMLLLFFMVYLTTVSVAENV
jgi:hypothetical protein